MVDIYSGCIRRESKAPAVQGTKQHRMYQKDSARVANKTTKRYKSAQSTLKAQEKKKKILSKVLAMHTSYYNWCKTSTSNNQFRTDVEIFVL